MSLVGKDYDVLKKFEFDRSPVGVKFLAGPPDKLGRLDEKLALCEMLKRAQEGRAFFADAAMHACEAGLYVLGQAEAPEPFLNGAFGAGLQLYETARSASRLYQHIPRIGTGLVHCVAFAPLDKLSFDPDVLILMADTPQTEILLRALSYRTGQMWISRYTPAIGCAWIFTYPYLSGELNYSITGLGHGMKRRRLFPEGRQIVSIPFDILPTLLKTLAHMPWVLPAYKTDGMKFVGRLLKKLGL